MKPNKLTKILLLKLTLIICLFSCSSSYQNTIISKREIPEICFGLREKNINLIVKPHDISEIELETLRTQFSDNAISIANDIGVINYLLELIKLSNKSNSNDQLILKKVYERISLSQMELYSMIAIVDCERDRTMQLASHLDLVTNNEVNSLSFKSLISTVAGTSFAALFELAGSTHQAYLAADVTFALISGYYAYLTINTNATGYLGHKNNLLRELKEKPDKAILFYTSVWNFINNENYPDEPSERDEILRIWHLNKVSQEDENLFFSKGGEYTSFQLYKLVGRYDTLKTRMAYMQLELRQLEEELEN